MHCHVQSFDQNWMSVPSYQSFICLYRYLIFYSPLDGVYRFTAMLPIKVVLSVMKEVTRSKKILSGITLAKSKYQDNLPIMISIAWAKGQKGFELRLVFM